MRVYLLLDGNEFEGDFEFAADRAHEHARRVCDICASHKACTFAQSNGKTLILGKDALARAIFEIK
jgi:hypothetical protein